MLGDRRQKHGMSVSDQPCLDLGACGRGDDPVYHGLWHGATRPLPLKIGEATPWAAQALIVAQTSVGRGCRSLP